MQSLLTTLFFHSNFLGGVIKQPSSKSEQKRDRKQVTGKTIPAENIARLKGKFSAV